MIEAASLRIGNYAMAYGKRIVKCTGIKGRLFYFETDRGIEDAYSLDVMEPIELTGDILANIRSGFFGEWTMTVESENLGDFETPIWVDRLILQYRGIKFRHIKHLHTLQNVFYAMYNEEFKIDIDQLKTILCH